MPVLQPIIDIAEICHAHGIRRVVVSPGSRSAALTLAFVRHGRFDIQVVTDERSAGFIALGMALASEIPVIMICTSGSASYNYAPAIAEAFFQQVPLLIFTADRPKEWIHQYDGQTIYQSEIFGKHVRKFFEIPSDYGHKDSLWSINRMVNDAILSCTDIPSGPVHINVPIREPFYPLGDEDFFPSKNIRVVSRTVPNGTLSPDTWNLLLDEWDDCRKILIVGGQHKNSEKLNSALTRISEELDVPVVGDCISNQKSGNRFISYQDLFLPVENGEHLRPDLLVTYGLSVLSKELKQFLQRNPAIHHWHVSEDTHLVDNFQSLTRQIAVSPDYFFENLFEKIDYQLFVQGSDPETDSSFLLSWIRLNDRGRNLLHNYLGNLTSLNDLTSIYSLILSLDLTVKIHVANSMPVRYLNILGDTIGSRTVCANRGTSGIDGCVSTAIGDALATENAVVLITGDLAFLYDRNGLLINPLPGNLRILIVNNAGGNIFRMIDGPSKLPELETYFEANHNFTAQRTAEDSQIAYFSARNTSQLAEMLKLFLASSQMAILEVFTDPYENSIVWKGLKNYVQKNW
jgi:2-succinyl-5-enolpyruvyl-6-hydroxy-3-cyclohexene-1-carboxylate synthase